MNFSRFITLLLKDFDNTLTQEEFIEYHEMLHTLYGEQQ